MSRINRFNAPWIFSLTFFALLIPAEQAFAWGRGHALIRAWAVARLPQWQRELVAEEHWQKLQKNYTSLQDAHAGGNRPDLDKYCVIPGVRLSLHDVNAPQPTLKALLWYFEQIQSRWQAKEYDEAMKFIGVVCHWNEDPGCPSAHSSPVNEFALKRLLPPPKEKERLNYLFGYGGIADVGDYTIAEEAYTPQLLGTTWEEAATRIYQHQRLLEQEAAAHIVPLVQDMMHGDGTKANEHRAEAALVNARHITNVLYTILCLLTDRISAEEAQKLATQPLSDWLSDFKGGMISHPYYVSPFLVNHGMDAQRNLHPLAFAGEGETEEVKFGYGMGTSFGLTTMVGLGRVYDRFTCRVGLHPVAGPNGKVKFSVEANGRTLGEPVILASGDPPKMLEVSLPDAEFLTLTLRAEAAEGSTPNHNLTVWGEPTLHRKSDH